MRSKFGLARISFGLAILSAVLIWLVVPLDELLEIPGIDQGMIMSIGVLLSLACVVFGVLGFLIDRESWRWAVAAVAVGALTYLSFGYWFNSQL